MFHDLLQIFNNRLGLDTTPDKDGIYNFDIDNLNFTIFDLSENNLVAFTGDLGEPPSDQTLEGLYSLLLSSQYLFCKTQGATFSLHPDTGHIILCQALPLSALTPETFFNAAEQFVNTLEEWSKIIKDYRSVESSNKAPDTFQLDKYILDGNILRV